MKHSPFITVVGAREHNLKNITVSIPKESLTVITGPSGSGKSSLAFDVLYAEGQRRYLESLSLYARQFLGMPPKAQCDRIDGLCPAIAIDQKTVGANPRSTVGTITEVYDYVRVLYARIGTVHCPECAIPVTTCTNEQIEAFVCQKHAGLSVSVMAPLAYRRKGTFVPELSAAIEKGIRRFWINGQKVTLQTAHDAQRLGLSKSAPHTIDAIIDFLEVLPQNKDERARLAEAIERSCAVAQGFCKIAVGDKEHLYSTKRTCVQCGSSFPELEPRLFSFNSPIGACAECHGLGVVFSGEAWFASSKTCMRCFGKRLNELALSVFIGGLTIYDIGQLSIKQAVQFFKDLSLYPQEREIAEGLLNEITHRLSFLHDVGLGYLSLNREARTLSGGEGQRIRLARQLGAALSGVLYILDEPSIGLHQRDNDRLIETLKRLRDLGNTVIVVEHDEETILSADWVIDIGPGAGKHGGEITAIGTPLQIKKNKKSLTGKYLSGDLSIPNLKKYRSGNGKTLSILGAAAFNLKDIDVHFPLGKFISITGVSGSGKSTLMTEILAKALTQHFYHAKENPAKHKAIKGLEYIDKVIDIDQSAIGRTPRSNPATYTGVFTYIRDLFAELPEAKIRGYKAGRFSFNVKGGRCEACQGDGVVKIEMNFLPNVYVECEECHGKRYNNEALEIHYKGKDIAEVLQMTVEEATNFFANIPNIHNKLKTLVDVGLGYAALGQSATTLSGGEAQRIKLATELSRRASGKTLYILDEPTTGLHFADVKRLLDVLQRLVDKGNTVLVIEHNLDVIKSSDWVIDLGPEGGDKGGYLVAEGTPKEVAKVKNSFTGQYLAKMFKK